MPAVAFTGVRHLNPAQVAYVQQIVFNRTEDEFVSGAAPGVDSTAALAAYHRHRDAFHRICVPYECPHNKALVNLLGNRPGVKIEYVRGGYMKRNDRLVQAADVLVAFPATPEEILRSGTWSTIRRAQNAGVTVELYPLSEA